MCGRYTLTVGLEELEARYSCPPSGLEWSPRYNVAPSQENLVVIRADKQNYLKQMKWGLIPHWNKDLKKLPGLINARVETLDSKPAFRQALLSRRCLVPADGFYEWQSSGGQKTPYRIIDASGDSFAFAGLWDVWSGPDRKPLESYTIVTTEANPIVNPIHSRMPLILPPDMEEIWLQGPDSSSPRDLKRFLALMHPRPLLRAYRVSRLVGNPRYDDPACISEQPDGEEEKAPLQEP